MESTYDGFGVRSQAIDPESGDPVEVLSFAPALVAAPEFATAVGERVARLASVRTPFTRGRGGSIDLPATPCSCPRTPSPVGGCPRCCGWSNENG
ncbi:MAG TPA: hypothetical protein VNJ02_13615 [Vicinamibacterales bacterium]|nr:hypothetical protein [Vicinamibacterales bacterium]